MATVVCDSVAMRPWMANLIGLLLGFIIGGEALFIWYSREPAPIAPSAAAASAQPQPRLNVHEAAQAQAPHASQPVELPRFEAPLPSQPQAEALPRVVYPDLPLPDAHKPGSAVAGTGFFVASDGSLLTAAHVVTGCKATRIASKFVRPTSVRLIALDNKRDV